MTIPLSAAVPRPLMFIRAPVATRSGYGEMSRDIVRHLIDMNRYDIVIESINWGMTPMNVLSENNPKDKPIIDRIARGPLSRRPDIHISISVPVEFQPIGQYNIGITAGLEVTAIPPQWIEGCNRMNTVWLISNFARDVFAGTIIEERTPDGQTVINTKKITVPLEVLHNCLHTDVMKKITSMEIPRTVDDLLLPVQEKFNFLFVGHWLGGGLGQDRKDVGMLIKTFLETFRNVPSSTRPGLILKTSGATFSIMDSEEIISKIEAVKHSIGGVNLPNVYLVHGDLSAEEMNGLYNHSKVKVHVSFTKGEGFGRPLLEATQSEKPIISSGWSGVLDFLIQPYATLLGGSLSQAAADAMWNGQYINGANWFNIDYKAAATTLHYVWKHYNQFLAKAPTLAKKARENFAYDVIQKKTAALMDKYVPQVAVPVTFELPKLRKLGSA